MLMWLIILIIVLILAIVSIVLSLPMMVSVVIFILALIPGFFLYNGAFNRFRYKKKRMKANRKTPKDNGKVLYFHKGDKSQRK